MIMDGFFQNKINVTCKKIEHNGDHLFYVVKQILKKHPEIEDGFYVLNLQEIVRRYFDIKRLSPRVQPFYAMKCNSKPYILQTLASLGCGFDCASFLEVAEIRKYNVSPELIIFGNPIKAPLELQKVAQQKVLKLTFDAECELYKIAKYYPDAECVLRIRCDAKEADFMLGSKFGCDPVKDGPGLVDTAKKLGLNLIGFAFHVGSGFQDYEVYGRAIQNIRTLFDHAKSVGYDCYFVDIGGGLLGMDEFDVTPAAKSINQALDRYFPEVDYPNIQIISEYGQYYVTSSIFLVCKILGKRKLANSSINYYLDETVYKAFIVALCGVDFATPNILNQGNYKNSKVTKAAIYGSSIEDGDLIYKDLMLPELRTGDWIYFKDMGAYTIACSRKYESAEPTPLYTIIDNEGYELLLNSDVELLREKDFNFVQL